jgi:uncharacterized cysteine cluster protein YcgN (CxxCxxCC family)
MDKTLKLLKPLVDFELLEYSLNDLALMYQLEPDTKTFATCFYKIFKLAITTSQKYWGLTEEDVASICLEKLDFCLRTYVPGNNLTTYFTTVFCNRLREETQKYNYKKRKCVLQSINDLINESIYDTYNVLEMLLPKNLTDKEYRYCMLLSEGYDNASIAIKLGVSLTTLSNYRKSLKIKLAGLEFL